MFFYLHLFFIYITENEEETINKSEWNPYSQWDYGQSHHCNITGQLRDTERLIILTLRTRELGFMMRMIIGMSLSWYCIQNYDTASGTDYRKKIHFEAWNFLNLQRERERKERKKRAEEWLGYSLICLHQWDISFTYCQLNKAYGMRQRDARNQHIRSSFLRLYFLSLSWRLFKAVGYIDSASPSPGKDRIVNECALGGWGEVEGLGWFH